MGRQAQNPGAKRRDVNAGCRVFVGRPVPGQKFPRALSFVNNLSLRADEHESVSKAAPPSKEGRLSIARGALALLRERQRKNGPT